MIFHFALTHAVFISRVAQAFVLALPASSENVVDHTLIVVSLDGSFLIVFTFIVNYNGVHWRHELDWCYLRVPVSNLAWPGDAGHAPEYRC